MTAKSEKCNVTETFKFFGDFRVLQILWKIDEKGVRFNEFLDSLNCMNAVTLTDKLNYLIEMGFVSREKFREIPPRVEYHLTPKGSKIKELVMKIADFGLEHGDDLFSNPELKPSK